METPPQAQPPGQGPIPVALPAPGIYINGFGVGVTSGDVYVVLMKNGTNIGVLNLSYTIAKSLGKALTQLIDDFEKNTSHTIMTSSDIVEALDEKQSNQTSTAV